MTPVPSYADRLQRAHAQLKNSPFSGWPIFADWFTDSGEQRFLRGDVSSRGVIQVLEKAWDLPESSSCMLPLVQILGPLLDPLEWSQLAFTAGVRGPLDVFQMAWEPLDKGGRDHAWSNLVCYGQQDSFDWILREQKCSEEELQDGLYVAVTKGQLHRAGPLLQDIQRPWAILKELRAGLYRQVGVARLDECWSQALVEGKAARPPKRVMNGAFAQALPQVNSILRTRVLEKTLPTARGPVPKPRF